MGVAFGRDGSRPEIGNAGRGAPAETVYTANPRLISGPAIGRENRSCAQGGYASDMQPPEMEQEASVLAALVIGSLVASVGALYRWRALPLARRTYRNGVHSWLHGETSVDGVERWYRVAGTGLLVLGLSMALWGVLLMLGVAPPSPPDA